MYNKLKIISNNNNDCDELTIDHFSIDYSLFNRFVLSSVLLLELLPKFSEFSN